MELLVEMDVQVTALLILILDEYIDTVAMYYRFDWWDTDLRRHWILFWIFLFRRYLQYIYKSFLAYRSYCILILFIFIKLLREEMVVEVILIFHFLFKYWIQLDINTYYRWRWMVWRGRSIY